jgi:type III pantothenate kinase
MTSHHAGIIDCGSAITVDLLRADGRHQGGYIIPGPRLMQQCLLSRTSQVEASPMLTEQSEPGASTQACVSQGTTRAIVAFLDKVMYEMPQQYDNRLEWLLTGGDSAWLQPLLAGRCRLVPDLVLRGLAYLVEGNE